MYGRLKSVGPITLVCNRTRQTSPKRRNRLNATILEFTSYLVLKPLYGVDAAKLTSSSLIDSAVSNKKQLPRIFDDVPSMASARRSSSIVFLELETLISKGARGSILAYTETRQPCL